MKVELIDYMGDDLAVVNAARVSFDKESEWKHGFGGNTLSEILQHPTGSPDPSSYMPAKTFLGGKDVDLIKYLAEHNHWSPFSHCHVKFRIKAPIFVARQLVKHQIGFSWNEVSRRYVDSEPEFYIPDYWRKRAENVKQGSSDDQVYLSPMLEMETENGCVHLPVELYTAAKDCYESLLKLGVCPEQARMVLPLATYTEWIWTGSVFAWSRMYNLRTDSHTQRETQEVAFLIGEAIEPLFPVSWKALTK